MTVFIGIDPGLDGGMAAVGVTGAVLGHVVMPVHGAKGKGKRLLDHAGVLAFLRSFGADCAVALEVQQAMPGQGVSSMFQIGRGFGALEMAVLAAGAQLHEVRPQAWQKLMLAGTPAEMDSKGRAAMVAQRLWPGLDLRAGPRCKSPHDGIVDALLLAEWMRRQRVLQVLP